MLGVKHRFNYIHRFRCKVLLQIIGARAQHKLRCKKIVVLSSLMLLQFKSIYRSKSASSVNNTATTDPETGNMLKDLDTALKASTNYIESHRTQQLPNGGHQEYHEYRLV